MRTQGTKTKIKCAAKNTEYYHYTQVELNSEIIKNGDNDKVTDRSAKLDKKIKGRREGRQVPHRTALLSQTKNHSTKNHMSCSVLH